MEDALIHTIFPLIRAAMYVFMSLAFAYGAKFLKQKFGIEADNAAIATVKKLATSAVMKVEGRAERYMLEKGEKFTGSMKHAQAVNTLLAALPDLSDDEAKHYIDEAVARIPGIGKIGVQ